MSYGLNIRFGGYAFRPGLWPSVFFALLLPLFLALGFWQMQRASEKTDILLAVEQRKQQNPIAIESIDTETDLFVPVLLQGSFISQKQFLLDNKIYQGRAGYEILAPFKLVGNGRIVLVSRGWVKTGLSREVLPNISFESNLTERVIGIFTRPSIGMVLGDALNTNSDSWPKVIQYPDYDKMGKLLGGSVIAGIVQSREPIGKEYPKNWQPIAFGPEKHYGYALQWFFVAFVLTILYIVLNSRKENQE